MKFLYHQFLSFPLLNALILIYNYVADLGIAIIILTILIRIILYPLFHKSVRNQTLLQKIQPKIKEINQKHKHDKEKQVKELLALYKEHKVNPLTGFFLLFLQLPILIALFQLFYSGLNENLLQNLYSFVVAPTEINFLFLGLINLQESSIFIVGLAAIAQYLQGRLSLPKKADKSQQLSSAEKMGQRMVLIGPILTLVILFRLPLAVGIYWLTTTIFSIGQQLIINKTLKIEEIKNHEGSRAND